MKIFTQIKCIIFDLDDTLLKSNLNYSLIKEELIENFLSSKKVKLPNLNQKSINRILELIKIYSSQNLDQAHSLVDKFESDAVMKAEIIPFVENTIKKLSSRFYKLIILTNNSSKTVDQYLKMDKFKFLHLFDEIITRNNVTKMKPHPDGINLILKANYLNKQNTVFIGDSVIDNQAAHKAGINFILIDSRSVSLTQFKPSPWKIINKFQDLSLIFT